MTVRVLATDSCRVPCFWAQPSARDFQEATPESREQSANCPLALGHDMLSQPWQVELAGVSPDLGRENMAPRHLVHPARVQVTARAI